MATATIAFDVSIVGKPSGRLVFDLEKCRHAQHLLQLVRAQKFRGSRLLFSPSMLFAILETQGGVTVPESLALFDQLLKDGQEPLPPAGALFIPFVPPTSLASAMSAPNSHFLISLKQSQHHDHSKNVNALTTQQPPTSAPNGEKKPRRPTKDRLQTFSATAAQATRTPAWTASAPLQFPISEATTASSDSVATVPTGTSMSNPHKLPMKYPIGDLSRIRPELRPKYNSKSYIADLIPSGDRTATTRNPPTGVKVGHFVSFIGVAGVYQIVGFEKVDLGSPEGLERWSQREGWSTEAAFTFGTQVATGRTQMLYKRVDNLTPAELTGNQTGANASVSALMIIGRLSAGSDLMHLLTHAEVATIDGCGEVIELE